MIRHATAAGSKLKFYTLFIRNLIFRFLLSLTHAHLYASFKSEIQKVQEINNFRNCLKCNCIWFCPLRDNLIYPVNVTIIRLIKDRIRNAKIFKTLF